MSKNSSTTGGIGFCGILFLIFLVLKLAEIGIVANWSWWWVTAPLWIPFLVVLSIPIVVFVFAMIVGLIDTFRK